MEVQDDFELNEEELFEHHSFKASKGQDPLRIDKFFSQLPQYIFCF